ncbi:hypothetical protein VNO80_04377 [Phaseolus coccineus]|uniref:Uncharacterized protein n=1 Tax=Phaseolus coccineus TaxID=3886 RepID=A0AAN9NXT0_PHACN
MREETFHRVWFIDSYADPYILSLNHHPPPLSSTFRVMLNLCSGTGSAAAKQDPFAFMVPSLTRFTASLCDGHTLMVTVD